MTEHTFALPGPINLQARVGRGSLTVNAIDDLAEARVVITPRADGSDISDRYVVALADHTLTVMSPREGGVFDLPIFGRSKDAVDVVVDVPSGTALRLSTFSADVRVHGRAGGADIAAGSADIAVDHVGGDLRVRYGSGTCRVRTVSGDVESRSGSGDAEFGTVAGSLRAGCGSGELRADSVGGDVRFRSGSGGAALGAVHRDVDLASGSGAMAIGIPAGRSAQLNITTGSGEVTSELPIEGVATSKSRPVSIRVRTGSGDIRLFRAVVPDQPAA
jgi:hypothetical protein